MQIFVYNIKYKTNATTISICGTEALLNFVDFGIGEQTKITSDSAPTEYVLELNLADIWDTEVNDKKIKNILEQKTGFEIITFNYKILAEL